MGSSARQARATTQGGQYGSGRSVREIEHAISLESVELRFGARRALSDITLQIRPGERVAVIGPSGAGKSSLLRLLNGTIAPTAGRVIVSGAELPALRGGSRRRLQREIGMIHQHLGLVGPLRVVHNVNAGRLGSWSLPKAVCSLLFPRHTDDVRLALRRVGIEHTLYERTERLSGGEQQRVAIARVLVQRPRVVLADEPVAALDRERAREVLDLLAELADELHGTLVTSLHDVGIARSRFHRVIGLRRGRVVFDRPADDLPEALLRELYLIDGEVDRA